MMQAQQVEVSQAHLGAQAGRFIRRVIEIREMALLLVVILTAAVLTLASPHFLSVGNLMGTAIGMATDALIVVGMTIALVSGGFDLSVGSVLAASGIATVYTMTHGFPIWAAVVLGLLMGVMWGFVNGFFITKVGLNPLITTLGTMSMARGIDYVISKGEIMAGLPDSFMSLGQGKVLGIPNIVLIAVVIVIAGDLLLRKMTWLRMVYYVGGNEKAAWLAGIPVNRVKVFVYLLTGTLAALAGVLTVSRFASGLPTMGAGTELSVITAVIIGGASLAGGEGTVFGAVLGLALVAFVTDGLILLNVSVYWQQLIQGAILLAAVSFDVLTHRKGRA
jgi:ribose transport system permease protein